MTKIRPIFGHDLGPNCLQRLSADDKTQQMHANLSQTKATYDHM